MAKYIALYKYIIKRVGQARKMMEFTQNDWDPCDIKNAILTKQGTYTIHAIILKEYPSTIILKHATILAKLNKFPYESLHNMMPHGD